MTDMPGKGSLSAEDELLLHVYLEQGMSSAKIALATGIPLAAVAWRRAQLGYHRTKTEWTRTMDATLREMRDAGHTIREIRLALGCSRTAVYERLVQKGISRRPRTEFDIQVRRLGAVLDDLTRQVAAQYPDDRHAALVASSAIYRMLNDPRLAVQLRPGQ